LDRSGPEEPSLVFTSNFIHFKLFLFLFGEAEEKEGGVLSTLSISRPILMVSPVGFVK
jgi:hypothetical protein